VFNLAATRPDLLTGVNPATGQPEPYGSVGVDINCGASSRRRALVSDHSADLAAQ
jgi:hypothetical protein